MNLKSKIEEISVDGVIIKSRLLNLKLTNDELTTISKYIKSNNIKVMSVPEIIKSLVRNDIIYQDKILDMNLTEEEMNLAYEYINKNNIRLKVIDLDDGTLKSASDNMLTEDGFGDYLKRISKIPLLTPDEEYELAFLAQTGNEFAKSKLIESNLRLVVNISKRYNFPGTSKLDLVQEGNLGLLKAVEKYDISKGCRFSTYATWWIRQTIGRSMMENGYSVRTPVHIREKLNTYNRLCAEYLNLGFSSQEIDEKIMLEMDLKSEQLFKLKQVNSMQTLLSLDSPINVEEESTLADFVADEDENKNVENLFFKNLEKEILDKLLKTSLTQKEQEIVKMRYGIGYNEQKTLNEIGEKFGVTRERIRQIEARALRLLRNAAKRNFDLEPEKIKRY